MPVWKTGHVSERIFPKVGDAELSDRLLFPFGPGKSEWRWTELTPQGCFMILNHYRVAKKTSNYVAFSSSKVEGCCDGRTPKPIMFVPDSEADADFPKCQLEWIPRWVPHFPRGFPCNIVELN